MNDTNKPTFPLTRKGQTAEELADNLNYVQNYQTQLLNQINLLDKHISESRRQEVVDKIREPSFYGQTNKT